MTLSFFRRHRKWFMVLMFAAVISMVFFLSWRQMAAKLGDWFGSEGGRQVVGSIDGRTVRRTELSEFYLGLKASGVASQWWRMALDSRDLSPQARQHLYAYTVGMTAWPLLAQSIEVDRPQRRTVMTWLALYEEARRRGFNTSAAEVDARIEELEALGLTANLLAGVLDQVAGGQRALLMEGLRKDMALWAYINWLSEVLGGVVEPEMRRECVKWDERIKVRLAVLRAEEALDQIKDVPEDVLQEHFGKYKKFLAGKSPEGYGYRIPDKVSIEYLVADPAAFEEAAAPGVADEAVRAYYDANKDAEFLVEQEKAESPDAGEKDDAKTADEEDDAKAADEKDEAKPAGETFRPFEEVCDEIRRKLVRRQAAALARERLHANAAEIRTMKKAPDLRIWADGREMRHVVLPGFHTAEELAEIEGIGKAAAGDDSLPTCAVAVVELVGREKARIGLGEISDVFTGADGEGYAFRVTAVEPNHEPADLEVVRDKVLADVRRAKAFEMVREKGKTLLEAASARKSLEGAAKDANVETVVSDWFPREVAIPYGGRWVTFPSALPKVGSNRLVVAECFRMAEDGRQRTLVTLAGQQMVVAAELVDRRPPREAAFDRMRPLLAQRVASRLAQGALREVLDSGAIQRRMTVTAEVLDDARPPDAGADAAGK